jgi:hydroxymethylpyrimidine pyrophosphatase-like HAD family hydrolase
MKKYLIFDLDGTLISSDDQIYQIVYDYVVKYIDPELLDTTRYLVENNQ